EDGPGVVNDEVGIDCAVASVLSVALPFVSVSLTTAQKPAEASANPHSSIPVEVKGTSPLDGWKSRIQQQATQSKGFGFQTCDRSVTSSLRFDEHWWMNGEIRVSSPARRASAPVQPFLCHAHPSSPEALAKARLVS